MVLTLVKLALISQGAKKDHATSTYGKPDTTGPITKIKHAIILFLPKDKLKIKASHKIVFIDNWSHSIIIKSTEWQKSSDLFLFYFLGM